MSHKKRGLLVEYSNFDPYFLVVETTGMAYFLIDFEMLAKYRICPYNLLICIHFSQGNEP